MDCGNKHSFTLVELLVVIAIIAILSTIGITQYSKSLASARDSKRVADMGTIMKALDAYFAANGQYPAGETTAQSGCDNWDVSAYDQNYPAGAKNENKFIDELFTGNYLDKVPIDPLDPTGDNNPSSATANNILNKICGNYVYQRFTAGANGCSASRGSYYVLGIRKFETNITGKKGFTSPKMPQASCTPVSDTDFKWYVGRYEK